MKNDPLEDTPFQRVPTVYSALDVRSLVEQPAKDLGITVGALQETEFYLTQYVNGKVDLLIDVTADSIDGGRIRRQLSVFTNDGLQVRNETVEPVLLLRLDASGLPICLMKRTQLTEAQLIREILRPFTEIATR